ncbi:hypothetical protein AO263_18570 [Pseudomonas sp. NZIPFR-PS5]|jgi:hypothetical protein|nr:hypothetical protein AO263_18570 [Pseudomonas sp. NZIPFR-PS5]
MQRTHSGELNQTLSESHPLNRVITQHQRMLQVETFGLGAVQMLVQAGTGEVIAGAGLAQYYHSIGALD